MLNKKIDLFIDKTNESSKIFREKYFAVIIKILDKLGLKANSLGTIRAFSGLLFFLLVKINFTLALIIVVLGGITDFFDGALARYQKKESDRGKFIDMLCDNIIFSFFLLGLIKIDFLNIANLAYFLFILPALYIIISINKNEFQKSDWIIHPIARISYYKTIFEIFFILTLMFRIFYTFDIVLTLLNIFITIHFAYHFYIFLNKKTS